MPLTSAHWRLLPLHGIHAPSSRSGNLTRNLPLLTTSLPSPRRAGGQGGVCGLLRGRARQDQDREGAAGAQHAAWDCVLLSGGHGGAVAREGAKKAILNVNVPSRTTASPTDCPSPHCAQICEAFGANRYPLPEEPNRQRAMAAEVGGRLSEMRTTLEVGDLQRMRVLQRVAAGGWRGKGRGRSTTGVVRVGGGSGVVREWFGSGSGVVRVGSGVETGRWCWVDGVGGKGMKHWVRAMQSVGTERSGGEAARNRRREMASIL